MRWFAGLILAAALAWAPPSLAQKTPAVDLAALQAAALGGDAHAAFELGQIFHHGDGVPADPVAAVRWWRIAGEAGILEAQVNLGYAYWFGEGAKQSYAEAMLWDRRAAEQGAAVAQAAIGIMYLEGRGVAEDPAEAVRWFRLAAEQGLALAQFEFGHAYALGEGVGRNLALAADWYLLAAEQGHVRAMEHLADIHVDPNNGIGQDFPAAFHWYGIAAAAGDTDAQYDLGIMYALGESVPVDYVEAYVWISLSIEGAPPDQDIGNRVDALDTVASALTPAERLEADLRIAMFVPTG